MDAITFEQLPHAVTQLFNKLENIERLLQSQTQGEPTEKDNLLTIEEAGQLINLKVPTIYGLVSRSGIPVSKKGKRLYFSKLELMEWVKSGKKKTKIEIEAEVENQTAKKRK